MKIEGEYLFNGPRADVWDMVRDPDVLATCIPGTQRMTQISPNEYEGAILLRIGPVSGTFSGKLTVANEVPPESCTLIVEGKGAAGFGKGTGNVHLTEQGPDKTLLKYTGELNIGGKLAGIGQRLIDSVGKSIINKGFDTLDKTLAQRMAAKNSAQ
jgi:uncharacterized protein